MLGLHGLSTVSFIHFVVNRPTAQFAAVYVNLGDSTQTNDTEYGAEILEAHELVSNWAGGTMEWFADWIGELNMRNADLRWWAYSSTAKNFLSSDLGSRVLEVIAIRNLARSGRYRHIYVDGATPGQMRSIAALLSPEFSVRLPCAIRLKMADFARHVLAIMRTLYQGVRIWCAFKALKVSAKPNGQDIVIVTYVDGPHDPVWDRYFGDLPTLIHRQNPATRIAYAAYIYTPYGKRLRELISITITPYLPLYQFLNGADLLHAVVQTMGATFLQNTNLGGSHVDAKAMEGTLREALLEDVSKRGYLHNLLVYKSAARMTRALLPKTVIYPYENKSLEKSLLLGVRAASQTTEMIGYQHTSITPRHVGLRFGKNEAVNTPLPNRIVTVGNITRNYLEAFGNYPAGMLVTGCALRQVWGDTFPPKPFAPDRPRVLLPLSSSVDELISALDFMRQVKVRIPGLELGIRPHLNFPLHVLPSALHKWVVHNAIDWTGTALRENLEWADLTAYVSSTVALESLMVGRPVIYLQIDPSNPDPLLGSVGFRWYAGTVDEFLSALFSFAALENDQINKQRNEAIRYVRDYLVPKSPEAIAAFLQ
jgi:hypothetical protein